MGKVHNVFALSGHVMYGGARSKLNRFHYIPMWEHRHRSRLLFARLLVSFAPTHIWTELWGFAEDSIWKRSHWCICYQAAACVRRCGIWKKKRWACVLREEEKKWQWGLGGGWQSSDKKVRRRALCQQSATRLPGVGSEIRPVREWGGWLNDFTSPFQLQQLPIYIVMQIHGLSQMVLFQHRGCTEIWLFIPSTSKVFNAPSSVCFCPFLSWQRFKICAVWCVSP